MHPWSAPNTINPQNDALPVQHGTPNSPAIALPRPVSKSKEKPMTTYLKPDN